MKIDRIKENSIDIERRRDGLVFHWRSLSSYGVSGINESGYIELLILLTNKLIQSMYAAVRV